MASASSKINIPDINTQIASFSTKHSSPSRDMDEAPVFRSSKRRKVASKYEKARHGSSSENESEPTVTAPTHRQPVKSRQKGVQFSNSRTRETNHDDTQSEALALVPATEEDPTNRALSVLRSKFVNSGAGNQVTDVDKHMMDYIDSQMTSRNQTFSSTSTFSQRTKSTSKITVAGSASSYTDDERTDHEPSSSTQQKSSTQHQHLSEVDLDHSTTQLNTLRTNALLSDDVLPDPTTQPKKPRRKKPQLGRDGKPLRPRLRKGPNPEDLARSALVEQLLHEHGLGTYDPAAVAARALGSDDKSRGKDESKDERMAADFQAQFLEGIAERQAAREKVGKGATATKDVGPAGGSGPRLGGSRAARARMAAAQQAQAQAQNQAGSGKESVR